MFNFSLVVFKANSAPMEFYPRIGNGNFFRILLQAILFRFIYSYCFHVSWRLIPWVSLAVAVILGLYIKHFKFTEILVTGLTSSICFFLITNFGAWLTLEMYEKNLAGLFQSYVLAIPFFHNTLISTLLYLVVLKLLFNFSVRKKVA